MAPSEPGTITSGYCFDPSGTRNSWLEIPNVVRWRRAAGMDPLAVRHDGSEAVEPGSGTVQLHAESTSGEGGLP